MRKDCDTVGTKNQSRDIGYSRAVCDCHVLKRVTLKSVNSVATVVGIDYRKRAPLCPVRAKWHALFIIFTERFSRVSRRPTWLAVFISAEVPLTNRVRIMHRFRSNVRKRTPIYTYIHAFIRTHVFLRCHKTILRIFIAKTFPRSRGRRYL